MENYTSKEYKEAKKTVEAKYGFYIHLVVYLVVNTFFHVMNFLFIEDAGGEYWAIWPALGWGIGLLFHGVGAFKLFDNSRWKEEQIRKELEKQREIRRKFDL